MERTEDLQVSAREHGIELSGWHLGAGMFCGLETSGPRPSLTEIEQAALGGGGLWLRAEPDEAPEQADALAASAGWVERGRRHGERGLVVLLAPA